MNDDIYLEEEECLLDENLVELDEFYNELLLEFETKFRDFRMSTMGADMLESSTSFDFKTEDNTDNDYDPDKMDSLYTNLLIQINRLEKKFGIVPAVDDENIFNSFSKLQSVQLNDPSVKSSSFLSVNRALLRAELIERFAMEGMFCL